MQFKLLFCHTDGIILFSWVIGTFSHFGSLTHFFFPDVQERMDNWHSQLFIIYLPFYATLILLKFLMVLLLKYLFSWKFLLCIL